MTWEYKVVRLTRTEPSVSWDEEGDPEGVAVSTVEEEALVTVWVGLEVTDLTPGAADQLAAFLRVAAARARNQQG